MDGSLIFEKTAEGEAAVNQRTRLVQRNLRTVLIVVDGVATVADLADKIGNADLVDDALRQLLDEGLIRQREVAEDIEVAEAERQASHAVAPEPPPVESTPNPFAAATRVEPRATVVEDEPLTAAHFKPIDVATLASATLSPKRRLGAATIVGGGVLLLALAFVALVLLHAAEKHRAAAQSALASAFGGTATIGTLASSGVPPTLVMRDVVVTVGQADAAFDEIRAGLGLGVLFGAAARLDALTVRGARLDVGVLAALAAPRTGEAGVAVSQVRLSGSSVRVGAVELQDLSGEITFAADGTLTRALLRDSGDQWLAELTPVAGGVQLALSAGEIKGFPDKASVLTAVKFVGSLGADGYRIDQIDIRAFDGIVEGNADLRWRDGWRLTGTLSAKQADLAKVASGLGSPLRVEGRANAALRFSATASTPSALWAASQGEGSIETGAGRVRGVDLVDAVRRASARGPIEGGETRFDNLTASPQWTGSTLELGNLRLSAGLMSATGTFRMTASGLSGAMNVAVGGATARIGGTLAVTGTAREPALRRQ